MIYPYQTETFYNLWAEWKEYRAKEHKFKFKSEKSEQAALIRIAEITQTEDEARTIIINSMSNGWKGLFPLKQNIYVKQATTEQRRFSRF